MVMTKVVARVRCFGQGDRGSIDDGGGESDGNIISCCIRGGGSVVGNERVCVVA